MTNTPSLPSDDDAEGVVARVTATLLELVSQVPPSSEDVVKDDPEARARSLTRVASLKAAGIAGALALPPGPLGYLTILPDLFGIWRIQAQLVSDIATVYGKRAYLDERTMLYCLFKNLGAQAVRDVVVRVGQRFFLRRVALRVLQNVAKKIGVRVTQRVLGRIISRFLPILGAGAVAAYVAYGTYQVGMTAIELFSSDIDEEGEGALLRT